MLCAKNQYKRRTVHENRAAVCYNDGFKIKKEMTTLAL